MVVYDVGSQQQTDHEKMSNVWLGICKVSTPLFTGETCIFILLMVVIWQSFIIKGNKRKFNNFSHPLTPIGYNLKFNLLPIL